MSKNNYVVINIPDSLYPLNRCNILTDIIKIKFFFLPLYHLITTILTTLISLFINNYIVNKLDHIFIPL